MKRPIINNTDVGDTEFNNIQLKSTEYCRRGLEIIIRKDIELTTRGSYVKNMVGTLYTQ